MINVFHHGRLQFALQMHFTEVPHLNLNRKYDRSVYKTFDEKAYLYDRRCTNFFRRFQSINHPFNASGRQWIILRFDLKELKGFKEVKHIVFANGNGSSVKIFNKNIKGIRTNPIQGEDILIPGK